MRIAARRRAATFLLTLALPVVAAACQVRTDVDVRVDKDGSGTVAVVVNLDREAAAQVPDLAAQLRTSDLRRAGWTVGGPTRTAGGGLRVSADKRFGGPAAAGPVLAELAGKSGPFGGFTVSRSHSFARTSWVVRGSVDLSKGLASFSDRRLTALLGGLPFGRPERDLVRLAHGSLAEAAPFRVTVTLPHAHGHTYDVRLGDPPLPIDAVSRATSSSAYALIVAAVLALLAAVLAFVMGGRTRRRPPRAERGMGTYQRPRYQAITDTEDGPPPGTGGPPELVRVQPTHPPRRPPDQPRRPSDPPPRPPDS